MTTRVATLHSWDHQRAALAGCPFFSAQMRDWDHPAGLVYTPANPTAVVV